MTHTKEFAHVYLPTDGALYCLMPPASGNVFIMDSTKPSDPASSESLSSHKSGSSKNLSIGFPTKTSSGGCGKCLRIALNTLRSLINPVL